VGKWSHHDFSLLTS